MSYPGYGYQHQRSSTSSYDAADYYSPPAHRSSSSQYSRMQLGPSPYVYAPSYSFPRVHHGGGYNSSHMNKHQASSGWNGAGSDYYSQASNASYNNYNGNDEVYAVDEDYGSYQSYKGGMGQAVPQIHEQYKHEGHVSHNTPNHYAGADWKFKSIDD